MARLYELPALGVVLGLGVAGLQWKPLYIPGTQPPYSDAVVNHTLLQLYYHKLPQRTFNHGMYFLLIHLVFTYMYQ